MLTSFLPVLGNPLYRRYILGNGLSLLGHPPAQHLIDQRIELLRREPRLGQLFEL